MGKLIQRTCPVCQMTYEADEIRLKHGRQITCSRACSYEHRAAEKRNRLELSCALCGERFTRAPSNVKGKHGSQFCSRACHYAGRSVGLTRRVVTKPYRYTVDGMTSLRKKGAYAYASGNNLAYPKTELAVADRLAELGVTFIHQHVVDYGHGAFVVDFFFPDHGLVVELDVPKVHTDKAKDARRDRHLQNFGIRTVRIVDDGIPSHMVKAVLTTLYGDRS